MKYYFDNYLSCSLAKIEEKLDPTKQVEAKKEDYKKQVKKKEKK